MSVAQTLYHRLRRMTSQRQRDRFKARVNHARKLAGPLLKRWHGTFDDADLEAALRARAPADFDILMVHTSVGNLLPMYQGDARSLLEMLVRLAGPRTLAMPGFFFGAADCFNRDYYRRNPKFDVRRTPSQMGLVTELFRRRKGVVRSLHPTHSVLALGPLAEELCASHHLSPWTFGEASPFGVMARKKTVIIGVGVEYFRSLTQVHSMEDILAERFPVPRADEPPVKVTIVNRQGAAFDYEMSRPISREYVLHAERLGKFAAPGDVTEWTFRGTKLYITQADKVNLAVESAALRGDSLYKYSPSR